MCAELARGGFQGLSAPLIDHYSHQLDDGVGARALVTKRDEGFWSSIEHPWLLLTGFLCTVLLIQLILGIVKERDALKAEKNGRWESIRSTREQVMSRVRVKHWAQRSLQNEKLNDSGNGESGKRDARQACCRRAPQGKFRGRKRGAEQRLRFCRLSVAVVAHLEIVCLRL